MSDTSDKSTSASSSASDAKAGLDALVNSLASSIEATAKTEQAIHTQLQSVMGATTQAITDLVKNNAYSPELAQETLKMQKTVIDSTISAIEQMNAAVKSTTGGSGSSDG